jgi:hypothetical protein
VSTACQSAAPAGSPTSKPAAPASTAAEAKPATSPGAVASPGAAAPAGSPGPAASPAAAAQPGSSALPTTTAKIDPSLASTWEGKTVTLIVGANAGGGYDTWARTIARYMPKYLPGTPNMIVQNMDGAGHRVATNFVYQAKPDGLTFGLVDRYIPFYQLNGEGASEGVRYDVTKLNWLASASVGTQVLAVRNEHGISKTNLTPMTQFDWNLAQQDPGSSPHIFAALTRELLGWKTKSIFGFAGNPEIALSIQRNETDGMITDSDTQERLLQAEFQSGAMIGIVQFGEPKDRPHLQGTSTMMDLLKDKGPEANQLFEVGRQPFQWSRPLMSPPGMPENMTSTMRAALWATFQDPEFMAEAQRLRLEVIPVPGETVQKLITDYLATPKSVVDKLNTALAKDLQ